MRLLGAAHQRRDGRNGDDGTARGRLRRHLTRGGLGGVEGAVEVGADGAREQVGL